MRRLLYLIPVALLALCAAGVPLYKDAVGFRQSGKLALAPSHWNLLSYSISAQGVLAASGAQGSTGATVSRGAKAWGFPAAAFLINKGDSSNAYYSSSSAVSAYSWLWTAVDGGLIAISLAFAVIYNRLRRPQKAQLSLYDELQRSLSQETGGGPAANSIPQPAAPVPTLSTPAVAPVQPVAAPSRAPVMDIGRRSAPAYTPRPAANGFSIPVTDAPQES